MFHYQEETFHPHYQLVPNPFHQTPAMKENKVGYNIYKIIIKIMTENILYMMISWGFTPCCIMSLFRCFKGTRLNLVHRDVEAARRGTIMKFLNHKPSNVFHAWVRSNGLRDIDLCFTHVGVLC